MPLWPLVEFVAAVLFEFFFLRYNNVILGEEIVAGDDIYGGSDRLLSKVIPKTGVVVK